MDEIPNSFVPRLASCVAMAWKDAVILELSEELKSLPTNHRVVALEYIHERCRRYDWPKVRKLLEKEIVQEAITDNEKLSAEFILLSRFASSEKYFNRVVYQMRSLLPKWQDGELITINDLYRALFPRKESIGEHEDCSGEVIVSGSYFRCRKCKTVGHEIRETANRNLVLLSKTNT